MQRDKLSGRVYGSPREEALEIALKIRRDILSGSVDPVAILRACLLIANNLGKNDAIEWINKELSGYHQGEQLPQYRVKNCQVYNEALVVFKKFEKAEIRHPIHSLLSWRKSAKEDIAMTFPREDGDLTVITTYQIDEIIGSLIDRCFNFLNATIAELQFGGVVEYLMEEIRRNTDEKLAALDKRMVEEAQSLYLNLTSTNPADWSKVGHSARMLLKLLADNVFLPRKENYRAKDGRTLEVGEPHYVNRLIAFLDENLPHDEKKFVEAELHYLHSYLKQISDYSQAVEHHPSIEKYHANMLAIHTYLIISEILRHVKSKSTSE